MAVNSAYRDAQSTNDSIRSAKVYKDLNLNFTKHPVKKTLSPLTDVSAVKRSVRNLVMYNHYEKPFHPEIGSGVRGLLFENMSPFISNTLRKMIEDTIINFEPRVELAEVAVNPNFDNNVYEVTVEFYIINSPSELVDMTFNLERIR
jgi:phage baseplate assembly protein W|tara:strand:+ start:3089 stop:3529 length:441 start_codon:yes stop_codon:yes gene_type:complete